MAFNVSFTPVLNHEDIVYKGIPWDCDVCHTRDKVLLKIKIDYDTLVLCKKCLMGAKRCIVDKEKELKNEKTNGSVSDLPCTYCGCIGAAYISIRTDLICQGCLDSWTNLINEAILQDVMDSVQRRKEWEECLRK